MALFNKEKRFRQLKDMLIAGSPTKSVIEYMITNPSLRFDILTRLDTSQYAAIPGLGYCGYLVLLQLRYVDSAEASSPDFLNMAHPVTRARLLALIAEIKPHISQGSEPWSDACHVRLNGVEEHIRSEHPPTARLADSSLWCTDSMFHEIHSRVHWLRGTLWGHARDGWFRPEWSSRGDGHRTSRSLSGQEWIARSTSRVALQLLPMSFIHARLIPASASSHWLRCCSLMV